MILTNQTRSGVKDQISGNKVKRPNMRMCVTIITAREVEGYWFRPDNPQQ